MGCVSSWIGHWLASLTISVPPLSQPILQAEQIVPGRFHDWVGVPIYPLETLAGYRRWLVQTLYPLLLGILAGVPLRFLKIFIALAHLQQKVINEMINSISSLPKSPQFHSSLQYSLPHWVVSLVTLFLNSMVVNGTTTLRL